MGALFSILRLLFFQGRGLCSTREGRPPGSPLQVDSVCIADDPVQDGITDRQVSKHAGLILHWELRCDPK